MNPWIILAMAVVAEVIGNTAMKYAAGMTKPGPTLIMVAGYVATVCLLGLATRQLEVGVVFAVAAGATVAVTAAIGMIVFGESVSVLKIAAIAMIIAGTVMLNLFGKPA